ncbi:hypothetical protein SAMN05216327_102234 [Dyadobacter sp. SG02]|uniref:alpha/beta fold hydrolase n=1 Tax=Dyadobacter sp. SG02 TaxID=1855291 RepID=UPI0008D5CE74|nr:alpha/beta hydrolase [Dyadobacter sp. SG02]SEI52657.1 hypothetical protein SAMN05216327_102234 [Dyadobacter sp. SG02]
MQNRGNTEDTDKGPLPLTGTNTIVIVHGAWSSANDWHNTADQLVSTGNRVIMVNLPGHGNPYKRRFGPYRRGIYPHGI